MLKADAEEARLLAGRLGLEAERARQAEEEAQEQVTLLEEALESLRSSDNPRLQVHQLQLLHKLPLGSICSLQTQICTCLRTVEQVKHTHTHSVFLDRFYHTLVDVLMNFVV